MPNRGFVLAVSGDSYEEVELMSMTIHKLLELYKPKRFWAVASIGKFKFTSEIHIIKPAIKFIDQLAKLEIIPSLTVELTVSENLLAE